MYVTRPLSLYRKSPNALEDEPPAEGPYSGYLVITDEEAEEQDTFCFGAIKRKAVEKLPFPQDKILNVVHSSEVEDTMVTRVWFIPVLDQPLASNHYYVIRAKGRYKGLACTSSREIDTKLCCFFNNGVSDAKPKPFDHRNVYQQFKIHRHHGHSFFAKSTATDSVPPKFLRRNGWELRISRSYRLQLNQALGLDSSLRKTPPQFRFPHVQQEVTFSCHRTMIHSCDKVNDEQTELKMSKIVKREFISVNGMLGEREDTVGQGGFWWFKTLPRNDGRKSSSVGLSLAIMEKMKWLQEEGGWYKGDESEVRVEREEETRSEESGGWRRYACYMLVESFHLSRMDRSLLRRGFRLVIAVIRRASAAYVGWSDGASGGAGGGRGADVGGMVEAVARVGCGATCVRRARLNWACAAAPLCSLSCNGNGAKTFKKDQFRSVLPSLDFFGAPLLQVASFQSTAACCFDPLHRNYCNFRCIGLVVLICSTSAPLQMQGDKTCDFNLLHCNFREIMDKRFVALIHSTGTSRRYELCLRVAPVPFQGEEICSFDLLR
ncbi:hypothetical protein CXB51_035366 [Gossypium anomalum]|uniref:Uncharacterized protein n=1 Tax=Gossypium anomalum TaxID=47600 RepID=A0A8J5XVZ3_9ROSI|nr:hypothetical protein CXB51_035366 [Gossypium anomalum]